ncbi:MAG: biotin transporter BioY [Clostridia bacterium]|nr:biotin transporter BioY [Clostridia bacterium]
MQRIQTRRIIRTALTAALLCLICPISVPFGPVPVTLATFAVCLAAGLLGPWLGACAVGLYLALGALGLPVFSGWSGGISRLFDITGGFLFGYIPLVIVSGLVLRAQAPRICIYLGVMAAMLTCHLPGALWFCYVGETSLPAAFLTASLAYLLPDFIKAIAAVQCAKILAKKLPV